MRVIIVTKYEVLVSWYKGINSRVQWGLVPGYWKSTKRRYFFLNFFFFFLTSTKAAPFLNRKERLYDDISFRDGEGRTNGEGRKGTVL